MNARSMLGTAGRVSVAAALVLLLAPAPGVARSAPPGGATVDCTKAFAGNYAVRRIEMGGGIALRPDGSFRYELSYGALDEGAQGRWTCDKTTVFLTSDPVDAPRFSILGADQGPEGELHIELDLPRGMSPRYFSALIRKADGSTEERAFDEDGLAVAFTAQARPLAIVPLLPVYGLAGEPIMLPDGNGFKVRLQFLPNDLGQVAFSGIPLRQEGRGLSLQRFGETIPLRRLSDVPSRR